jgi:hypothetical protein
MNSTTKKIAHRLRQARVAMLRTQLALTGAQILFWLTLIGVVLGVAARVLNGRRRAGAHAVGSTPSPASFPAASDREATPTHSGGGQAAQGE